MGFDIEQMRKNRDAGTPGPWSMPKNPIFGDYCGSYVPSDWRGDGRLAVFHVTAGPDHAAPNARRIASVPDMEAEIERLTAALETAEKTIQEERGRKWTVLDSVWKRRAEDAEAALETARADALREAAEIAKNQHVFWAETNGDADGAYPVECDVSACENISSSILALIEKEGDA